MKHKTMERKHSLENCLQCNSIELNEQTIDNFRTDNTRLDLRNRLIYSIKSFDFMFPSHFESIDLSGNLINTIPRNVFDQSHNLKSLKVNSNCISVVHFDEFSKMQQLEELSLSYNFITSIEDSFLSSVTLRIVNLCHNLIAKIEPFTFTNLVNLKTLNLSCNRVHYLSPFAFFRNFHLEYLFLDNNYLRTLDENLFANLAALRCLHLQNNSLDALDQKTFMFNHDLKVLNVENNRIGTLSEFSFSSTIELVSLRLHVTMLISFVIFSKITNLEAFHIEIDSDDPFSFESSCLFVFLAYQLQLNHFKLLIKYLESCNEILFPMSINGKEIHIECLNPIKKRPITKFSLVRQVKLTPNLRKLVLIGLNNLIITQWNSNRLTRFYFEKMLWLDFAKSKMSSSNGIIREQFQSLKHLDMSFCIVLLNAQFAFKSLINLEFLNLEGTPFSEIKKTTFRQNVKLKLLNMQKCSIQSIDDFSFETLKDLDYLNLKNNLVFRLNDATFYGLNRSKTKIYV